MKKEMHNIYIMYSITCAYRKLVCMYKEIYIYIVVPTVALDHSQI